MNRNEFSSELRHRLSELKNAEINKTIEFYNEMIDERIDAGLTEEEAVADLGNIDDIVNQVKSNAAPESIKSRISRFQVWQWVLIIIGAPLWLPLLISLVLTVLSVYLGIWSAILGVFVSVLALIISAVGFLIASFGALIHGLIAQGILYFGLTLTLTGLGILIGLAMIELSKLFAKGTVMFCKWLVRIVCGKKV